jgi:hypothetical protein
MFEAALIAWDDEDDPIGNVQHINHNSVSTEEFESILTSHRSSGGEVGRVADRRPGVTYPTDAKS